MSPFLEALTDEVSALCPGVSRDVLSVAVLAGYSAAIDRAKGVSEMFRTTSLLMQSNGQPTAASLETAREDGADAVVSRLLRAVLAPPAPDDHLPAAAPGERAHVSGRGGLSLVTEDP